MYPWCLSAFNMMFIKINIIMINKNDNNNLEIAHPLSGSSSTLLVVKLEFGKPEYPEENLAEQGREPTTNSTQI